MAGPTEASEGQKPKVEGASGPEIRTGGGATGLGAPDDQVTKVIVAVHGVGDQYSYATIQSVVNRFCSFYDEPAAVPLGNFHTGEKKPFSLRRPPYPEEPFKSLAFAEVYWATIPRTVVDEKHTLEEAKSWAHTIVERFRMRWRHTDRQGGCREQDFPLLKQVLTEMIQTIAVLERISFLADRAGLFTFDLKKLLEDYLGDVQIVTEFGTKRTAILEQFNEVMVEVYSACRGADIYIVAHSEGTVVSLLGLMTAYAQIPTPEWAGKVRGFMTLGSPIDKHLLLWPDLFTDPKTSLPMRPVSQPPMKIEWRNYYDHGDPIGFALDHARSWLGAKGWQEVFEFTKAHDIGFTRYPFPGKAHLDYWTDDDVFHHFIGRVVQPSAGHRAGAPATSNSFPLPKSKRRYQLSSYTLPYIGVAMLVLLATYILFKAVTEAIDPEGKAYPGWTAVAGEVAVTALFIMGVTVAARIPRLTRSKIWRCVACAIGVALAWPYLRNVDADLLRWGSLVLAGLLLALGVGFSIFRPSWGVVPLFFMGVIAIVLELLGMSLSAPWDSLLVAFLLVAFVYGFSALKPSWGMVPLILMGIIAIVFELACDPQGSGCHRVLGRYWPAALAAVAFFYLWWLAALLFDLVFVWHWYIRWARLPRRMGEVLGATREADAPG